MAPQYPTKEFGKRLPPSLPQQPIKRSGHVALLVMGTIAAGTTAYALMPATKCDPLPDTAAPAQATATPATAAQTSTACSGNSRSGGHGSSGSWWSRSSYFGGDSSSHSSSSSSSDHASGGVTRGGFGSWAHGFFGGS